MYRDELSHIVANQTAKDYPEPMGRVKETIIEIIISDFRKSEILKIHTLEPLGNVRNLNLI